MAKQEHEIAIKQPTDADFCSDTFFKNFHGYSTLDHLVNVLNDRTEEDPASIRRKIHDYGPQTLWDSIIAPALDEVEQMTGVGWFEEKTTEGNTHCENRQPEEPKRET